MTHLYREPVRNETGGFDFHYHGDCPCHACGEMRARHDSYNQWLFTRAGELLHELKAEFKAAVTVSELAHAWERMVHHEDAMRQGLENWQGPALPFWEN